MFLFSLNLEYRNSDARAAHAVLFLTSRLFSAIENNHTDGDTPRVVSDSESTWGLSNRTEGGEMLALSLYLI